MLEGHDILCCAPGPWDDIWRNRHHIMTRLARANRILYVEPWTYVRPLLRKVRSGGIRFRDIHGARLRQVDMNLFVYEPPLWAPRAERAPLRTVTSTVHMGLLRRALRQLGFQSPILWLFLPDMEVYIGQFDEQLVVYHIVDEYAGYAGVSETWRPVMQRMERQLARRADLVFVTSPTLLASKQALSERVILVPNAVDYAAFSAALAPGASAPADMATIVRPVAGYVGAINDKLDLALLARIAARCEEWSFVLVGPISITDEEGSSALDALHSLSNVHLLGRKTVGEVPQYIAACDVCLLPYRTSEWTRHIDSLKLYEYLACGKPVVATDVPTAQRFAPMVVIAKNDEEFLTGLRMALQGDSPERQAERRGIASQNTWEQRVDSLSAAIERRLQQRVPAHA